MQDRSRWIFFPAAGPSGGATELYQCDVLPTAKSDNEFILILLENHDNILGNIIIK